MSDIELWQGDCLELMKNIPDKSIDMILCDLPYGVTSRNKWDSIIPFESLWESYHRVIKDNGAIRISFNIFNTKDEIDILIDTLNHFYPTLKGEAIE